MNFYGLWPIFSIIELLKALNQCSIILERVSRILSFIWPLAGRTVHPQRWNNVVIKSKRSYVQYAKIANYTISSQTARGDVSTIRYPEDGTVLTEMKEDVKHVKMLFTMMKSGLAKHVTRSDKNIKDLLSSQGRIRDPRPGRANFPTQGFLIFCPRPSI